MDTPTIAEKLRANLKWLRENNASEDEVQGEIAKAQRAINKMSRAERNAADIADADAPNYAEQVNRRLLALTSQVPGAHALIAAGRAVGGETYADAAKDITESVKAYDSDAGETWRRRGLKLAGGVASTGAAGGVTGSLAKQAGLIGAAGGAGTLNPDMGGGERVTATALGGLLGLTVGKLASAAGTGVQSMFQTRPAVRLLQMQARRAADARRLYAIAEAEGKQAYGPVTKQLDDFVNEPDIREIVDDLLATRQYRGMSPTDPKVLDGIYKELSDWAGVVAKGRLAPTPSRPNVGRIREQDIKAAGEQGLEAISGHGGPMPTYARAVKNFAKQSREIEAYKRGYQALSSEAIVGLPGINTITQRSPEALGAWLAKTRAHPEAVASAAEGVMGGTREAVRRMSLIRPLWSLSAIEALSEAPTVLRAAGLPSTTARSIFDAASVGGIGGLSGRIGGMFDRAK